MEDHRFENTTDFLRSLFDFATIEKWSVDRDARFVFRGVSDVENHKLIPAALRSEQMHPEKYRQLWDIASCRVKVAPEQRQGGVRPGGKQTVGVEGLSEGTESQLYLALRLAILETDLSSREPIPFIVDDILKDFDDDRSVAALRAFARLSEKTQVILFTHHRHLVRLAEENLNDEVVFTHDLERTGIAEEKVVG